MRLHPVFSRPTFHRSAQEPATSAPASDDLSRSPRYHSYQFHSAILPDDRQILVYLPPQYFSEPQRRFPTFYLHDGQNLFDGAISYLPGRTWQAHTTADRLALAGEIHPPILIGIANTGLRRMAEYTPTRDFKLGGGEGHAYARLIVEELKPFIDRTYRTLPSPRHTSIGGSSLGGLISLYAGLEFSNVFSGLAVLSPSLWWNHRSILSRVEHLRDLPTRPNLRIWLDMGTEEGARHLRDTDRLYTLLVSLGWVPGVDLVYRHIPGATHDETSWAARFDTVLQFLFPPQ